MPFGLLGFFLRLSLGLCRGSDRLFENVFHAHLLAPFIRLLTFNCAIDRGRLFLLGIVGLYARRRLLLLLVDLKQRDQLRQSFDCPHNIVDLRQLGVFVKHTAHLFDNRLVCELVARRHLNPLTEQMKKVFHFGSLNHPWLEVEAD